MTISLSADRGSGVINNVGLFSILCVCVFMLPWPYTSPFGLVMFPMEHRQALEQEAERTDTHKTHTSSLSLTETWCRVIWEGTG